jgi:serine phosphatase RsbU (regulator of sigma subunit)
MIHLALLALVAAGVSLVAREVYGHSREQALAQARVRHELIARQTSRAIQGHYTAILADLEVLSHVRKNDHLADGLKGEWVLAPALWSKMGERVSHLLRLDPITMELIAAFPAGDASDAKVASILADGTARQWLRSVRSPTVSGYRPDFTGGYTLVAVPVDNDALLVAVVPFASVQRLFLDGVNQAKSVGAVLMEDSPTTGSTASFPQCLGFIDQIPDPSVRAAAQQLVDAGNSSTLIFDVPEAGYRRPTGGVLAGGQRIRSSAPDTLRPRMFTVEPLRLPGKHSAVVISSWVDDLSEVARATFRRAAIGAGLVLLVVTGLLASTSVQLIRGRLRLERLRHQLLTKEISQARKIQLAWLPSVDSGRLRACDIAAANLPASHVSGDFYDWFELDASRVAVTIGDVTGHGMAAAFLMATTQLLVRTTMRRVEDPGRCLAEVNRQLCNCSFGGQFVTMLVAIIDTDRGEIEMATAGHYPPMLIECEADGGGARPLPVEPALVLGVEPDVEFPTTRSALPAGAGLLFYTDGVIEARAPGGEHFMIHRLRQALEGRHRRDEQGAAKGMVDAVVAAVESFRGRRELLDDLTLVAVQLQASSPAARRTEPLVTAL